MSIRLTCGRSQVQVLYRPPEKTRLWAVSFFAFRGLAGGLHGLTEIGSAPPTAARRVQAPGSGVPELFSSGGGQTQAVLLSV